MKYTGYESFTPVAIQKSNPDLQEAARQTLNLGPADFKLLSKLSSLQGVEERRTNGLCVHHQLLLWFLDFCAQSSMRAASQRESCVIP